MLHDDGHEEYIYAHDTKQWIVDLLVCLLLNKDIVRRDEARNYTEATSVPLVLLVLGVAPLPRSHALFLRSLAFNYFLGLETRWVLHVLRNMYPQYDDFDDNKYISNHRCSPLRTHKDPKERVIRSIQLYATRHNRGITLDRNELKYHCAL